MHVINIYTVVLWSFVNTHTSVGNMWWRLLYQGGRTTRMWTHVVTKLIAQVTASRIFSKMPPNLLCKRQQKWQHCTLLTPSNKAFNGSPPPARKSQSSWVDKVLDAGASAPSYITSCHTPYLPASSVPSNSTLLVRSWTPRLLPATLFFPMLLPLSGMPLLPLAVWQIPMMQKTLPYHGARGQNSFHVPAVIEAIASILDGTLGDLVVKRLWHQRILGWNSASTTYKLWSLGHVA